MNDPRSHEILDVPPFVGLEDVITRNTAGLNSQVADYPQIDVRAALDAVLAQNGDFTVAWPGANSTDEHDERLEIDQYAADANCIITGSNTAEAKAVAEAAAHLGVYLVKRFVSSGPLELTPGSLYCVPPQAGLSLAEHHLQVASDYQTASPALAGVLADYLPRVIPEVTPVALTVAALVCRGGETAARRRHLRDYQAIIFRNSAISFHQS